MITFILHKSTLLQKQMMSPSSLAPAVGAYLLPWVGTTISVVV